MRLTYHGQHGQFVTIGNPGVVETVTLEAGVERDVPDELARAVLAEQPGTFTTGGTPPKAAHRDVWESFRASQGHDVTGLTKDELINLPDSPASVAEEAE